MRSFFVVLLFLFASCNKEITAAPPAAERQVTEEAADFTPNSVTIREGGKVRFVFGGTAHSIIFTEQPGRPENIEVPVSNTTEERVFPVEGSFNFYCNDHRNMTGTVIVEAITVVE